MVRRVFSGVEAVMVQGLKPVKPVSKEYLAIVNQDPLVQDWLFGVTENQTTRDDYLESFSRFIQWSELTPAQIIQLKRGAMKEGEPFSDVERALKRFQETLRQMGYAGKARARDLAAVSSFVTSKGYSLPKKFIRIDISNKYDIRVPTHEEVGLFLQYAGSLDRKLLYAMITDSPCRPRVFPAVRWAWLEPEWWEKDFVYVNLPKQFRPGPAGGPRKFEPPMFLGPVSLGYLRQIRDNHIKAGHVPLPQDHMLRFTQSNITVMISRDYKKLTGLNLIRPCRTNEKGEPNEQALTPKSWRKFQFNIIDSLTDISPEWRKMLKGRDLATEKYYSLENIEALRRIYIEKIYPKLWPNTAAPNPEKIKALEDKVNSQGLELRNMAKLLKQLVAQPSNQA